MNATSDFGSDDAFASGRVWDDETATLWSEALAARSAAASQLLLRKRLRTAARLRLGDAVVEVGCGVGALLVELAQEVGRGGRVIGVEPQPRLAARAREVVAAAGVAEQVEIAVCSGEQLPLPTATAAASIAQTTLIHVPQPALAAVLGEMRRVVRGGGTVVSSDQDGDTWTIDHPDRQTTRRIVEFNSDQRYADGWRGRQLARLFAEVGLREISVEVIAHVDRGGDDSYLHGMAVRCANAAVGAGAVTAAEAGAWLAELDGRAREGRFFSSINHYICVGRVP